MGKLKILIEGCLVKNRSTALPLCGGQLVSVPVQCGAHSSLAEVVHGVHMEALIWRWRHCGKEKRKNIELKVCDS